MFYANPDIQQKTYRNSTISFTVPSRAEFSLLNPVTAMHLEWHNSAQDCASTFSLLPCNRKYEGNNQGPFQRMHKGNSTGIQGRHATASLAWWWLPKVVERKYKHHRSPRPWTGWGGALFHLGWVTDLKKDIGRVTGRSLQTPLLRSCYRYNLPCPREWHESPLKNTDIVANFCKQKAYSLPSACVSACVRQSPVELC